LRSNPVPVGLNGAPDRAWGLCGEPLHLLDGVDQVAVERQGLVLVEAGALEALDVLADQGDLVGQDLERILGAHARRPSTP
jgi:hypothetical protein